MEIRRRQPLEAVVDALERALPASAPPRVGAGRAIWDVLADHLRVEDVRDALNSLARAPGGELTPTAAGNVAMCSAESSALMAVNFLAPFGRREGLFGRPAGSLAFERQSGPPWMLSTRRPPGRSRSRRRRLSRGGPRPRSRSRRSTTCQPARSRTRRCEPSSRYETAALRTGVSTPLSSSSIYSVFTAL